MGMNIHKTGQQDSPLLIHYCLSRQLLRGRVTIGGLNVLIGSRRGNLKVNLDAIGEVIGGDVIGMVRGKKLGRRNSLLH
jgi:hypothetical protein